MTDEDEMIKILENHRDVITYIIEKLESAGVSCRRTRGKSPGSDILLINAEQEELAKEVISGLHTE